jgi:hypothetical protein
MLERGACVLRATSPVVSRIIREQIQVACVPQLVNDAIVGLAVARQQQSQQPRDDT